MDRSVFLAEHVFLHKQTPDKERRVLLRVLLTILVLLILVLPSVVLLAEWLLHLLPW